MAIVLFGHGAQNQWPHACICQTTAVINCRAHVKVFDKVFALVRYALAPTLTPTCLNLHVHTRVQHGSILSALVLVQHNELTALATLTTFLLSFFFVWLPSSSALLLLIARLSLTLRFLLLLLPFYIYSSTPSHFNSTHTHSYTTTIQKHSQVYPKYSKIQLWNVW